MNYIAYYRVSTDKQGRSGLGLEAQLATVENYAARGGEILASFQEIESQAQQPPRTGKGPCPMPSEKVIQQKRYRKSPFIY